MRHPLSDLPAPATRHILLLAAILSALSAAGVFAAFQLGPGLGSVVDLAMAGSVASAELVLANWSEVDRSYVAFANGLDFLLGLSWGALACTSTLWVTRRVRSRALAWCGCLLGWGSIAVVVLDIPENVSCFALVRGEIDHPWPQLLAAAFYPRGVFFLAWVLYMAMIVRSPSRAA